MKKIRSLHWFLKFSIIFFIIILVLFFLSLLNWILPTRIISNTEVRGIIFENQIWKGTILVSGDTFAIPGTTITMDPGTKVLISRFGDKNNYDFLPWHLKEGVNTGATSHGILQGEPFWNESKKVQLRLWKVLAKGTVNEPIIVSSDNPSSDNIYDVNLIRFEDGDLEYVNFSNYRRFEIGRNILIKNSSFKNTAECAICINRGSPTIVNNIFETGKREFISVGLASPMIMNNTFLESQGNGILYNGISQSEVKIVGNTFKIPNKKALIIMANNLGGIVSSNIFDQSDIEIPCNSKLKIVGNNIKSKIIFRNPESCKGEYIVGENFWNTTDIDSVINTKFIGQTQNFRVIVPSILMNAPF